LWGISVQFPTFLILFLDGMECRHYLLGHFTRGQGARKLCEISLGGAGEGWRRMEKMSWTDRLRNEMLEREDDERNILHAIKEGRLN
jgi:succinate dehydrogenase/fumarate reductase flavoprotein subunit